MKPLELITVKSETPTYSEIGNKIKIYIESILSSGLNQQATSIIYSDIVSCLIKKQAVDFVILPENLPLIAMLDHKFPRTPHIVVNLKAIDPDYMDNGAPLKISSIQILIEALSYGAIFSKIYYELYTNKQTVLNLLYQPTTDIYYSLVFRLLGKPFGLLELSQEKQGILKYCFSKYISQNWFDLPIDKAHTYSAQAVLSGKIIDFEHRNSFLEELKRLDLQNMDLSTLANVFNYIKKDLVVGITLDQFAQMIFKQHGIYSIIAFERFPYFITTVVASKYMRKIPVSMFFNQVNKNSALQITKMCDVFMKKKILLGC